MELFQSWLKFDVVRREWVYQLDDNFEKIKDKYVYLRIEGIQKMLQLVRSLNEQEEISVFLRLQNYRETNIALHILAYVLQNLPQSILEQSSISLPKVCLKEETPPTTRPASPVREISSSSEGAYNSVIIKGSAPGTSTNTFNNSGTYRSVIINSSTDSLNNGTYNSVIINSSTDSFNSVVIVPSANNSRNNTYNSMVINDDEAEGESDDDYNTVAYNTTGTLSKTLRANGTAHKLAAKGRRPTDTEERAWALELLQGVCLIHPASKTFLSENGILPLLILLLEVRDEPVTSPGGGSGSPSHPRALLYSFSAPTLGRPGRKFDDIPKKDSNFPRRQEIIAVLDTLLCMMVDHEPLQKEFLDLHGVEVCVKILKNTNFGREVRAKCVEFLVYLVRYFPIGHNIKPILIETFGEQLVNVLMRSVRLGQAEPSTIPGESFLDAFSVESVK